MKITIDYLKDKVHEQFLELQELRKSYDELTKSALRLDKIVKEKQEEIDQLKAREEEHQRLNGKLREEIERLNNIIKRLEEDLREMYLTFGEFSEEYTEKRIKELKGNINEKD